MMRIAVALLGLVAALPTAADAQATEGADREASAISLAPSQATVPDHSEIVYLPVKRMTGILTLGFEISRFNRCWFDMTRAAAARFRRLAPEASGRGPHRYRVAMMGMRTPSSGPAIRYGHLGMYPCQILATRIMSVERVPFRR